MVIRILTTLFLCQSILVCSAYSMPSKKDYISLEKEFRRVISKNNQLYFNEVDDTCNVTHRYILFHYGLPINNSGFIGLKNLLSHFKRKIDGSEQDTAFYIRAAIFIMEKNKSRFLVYNNNEQETRMIDIEDAGYILEKEYWESL